MDTKEKRLRIIAKPNSRKNEISFDSQNGTLMVSIKARAENNKANMEIVKLLSKHLKKKVRIVSGLRSKDKVIEVEQ